ncbi:hypothetical protein GDO78_010003 [Eleutherodactylus coqui]|uniref:Uncharacterized protein n=1 Tax=Eleutherodactylus coqui TaxID=57060 RepID=A0A8J6KA96_ELECQ|nr:hypothetical protein GDO78_010003 [Eleutherodactylus coqui]
MKTYYSFSMIFYNVNSRGVFGHKDRTNQQEHTVYYELRSQFWTFLESVQLNHRPCISNYCRSLDKLNSLPSVTTQLNSRTRTIGHFEQRKT